MSPSALLAQTLTLEGPDAATFAQAQFSSDMRSLRVGHWQWSGWLDAQGRVRALLQIARQAEDRYLILLRGGDAARMGESLRRFLFRSKVKIDVPAPRALLDGDAIDVGRVREADNGTYMGMGTYSLLISERDSNAAQAWRAGCIADGHPWLPDNALDLLLPPTLSMERLEAVSFNKGCFPGQEIAARLHYRGGLKRHLYRVGLSQYVEPGSSIIASEKECGIVLDVASTEGHIQALAVIADDAVAQNTSISIRASDNTVDVQIETSWEA